MKATESVNSGATKTPDPVLSLRYPTWKRRLLESIRDKRPGATLSDILEEALDEKLTRHGLLEAA